MHTYLKLSGGTSCIISAGDTITKSKKKNYQVQMSAVSKKTASKVEQKRIHKSKFPRNNQFKGSKFITQK